MVREISRKNLLPVVALLYHYIATSNEDFQKNIMPIALLLQDMLESDDKIITIGIKD